MLTTITPFWKRTEMLPGFVKALRSARVEGVHHLIYFINEVPPGWWESEVLDLPITTFHITHKQGEKSIGYYHNRGAHDAETEWIMKLDVDCLCNVHFFRSLVNILSSAEPKEWFNVGMLYADQRDTCEKLSDNEFLTGRSFEAILRLLQSAEARRKNLGGTNFVCRRSDYTELGGCLEGFKGWGWEDYQQLYMLETYRLGRDPLPGPIDISNVTKRCRDEIAHPKIVESWKRDPLLCLVHRWHAVGTDPGYRQQEISLANKQVLLNYIRPPL